MKLKALALGIIATSAVLVSPLGEASFPKLDFKGFILKVQGAQAVIFMANKEGEVRLRLASVASGMQLCGAFDGDCRDANYQISLQEDEAREILASFAGKNAKAELYAPNSINSVAVVSVDGKDLSVELVREGKMVFCANRMAPNQDAVLAAQDDARKAKRGVWKIRQDLKTPPHCEAVYRAQ